MNAEQLNRVKADLGLSAREMADRLGLARNTMNRYLNDQQQIPHYIGLAVAALVAGLPGYPDKEGK